MANKRHIRNLANKFWKNVRAGLSRSKRIKRLQQSFSHYIFKGLENFPTGALGNPEERPFPSWRVRAYKFTVLYLGVVRPLCWVLVRIWRLMYEKKLRFRMILSGFFHALFKYFCWSYSWMGKFMFGSNSHGKYHLWLQLYTSRKQKHCALNYMIEKMCRGFTQERFMK